MYLNKVYLIGNLTRDPELRSLPSGVPVANFSIATNRVWKDRDGNKQETSEFHNIVVFSRQAETSAQYLKKGQSVLVEGRIQTRSWDAQDGQKKYRTEIIADTIQFGPKASGGGGYGDGGGQSTAKPAATARINEDVPPEIEYPDEESSEDIPF